MSGMFLWIGLTLILAFPAFGVNRIFELVGAILMTIGCVLLVMGR